VIDRRAQQSQHRRGWNALSGPVAAVAEGESDRRGDAKTARERALWLAVLPIYVVLAIVVTIAYAVAVLVADVRSWFLRDSDPR
jgi:hypothetical protein